jgi:hypothetical protein
MNSFSDAGLTLFAIFALLRVLNLILLWLSKDLPSPPPDPWDNF